ncbi:fatty acid desaturase family protein [Pseudoxanthomonas wuyuanensis]|uniref:Linoleoyl-CoA desaturase n=1 Tax=Pseudoxanthomonas wuyuanensis TaxID=1073196 RepID=A0A286CVK4_9GAMM|nr:fatty acid desaturase [Pseudoxanthomonas wuyuanensis]KAF1721304.1 acyl-CoA desaturase [Pseudoxanthomonas wuyuanensis]SOD50436.1 linoleoyl-CoA desaturase [Pseudoxanthomonas wuyuanensis]
MSTAAPTVRNRALSPEELDRFGEELDALRARTVASLGPRDARYIRNVVKAVRYSGLAGRVLLFAAAIAGGLWLADSAVGWLFWVLWAAGALALGLGKILENMELGHNVIHGQYDWLGDPQLNGKTYDWDIVATADNWRYTHNYRHHTYTNVRGMDDDIGYGLLRIFPEQKWKPFYLLQPLIAVFFALYFQWGVAIQDLKLGRWWHGKMTTQQLRRKSAPVVRKMGRQLAKDYMIYPALAGPFFLPVLLGNLVANGLRNVWTYVIIFCGHFTTDAETFSKECIKNESRGHWYLRQLRGSSNLRGGFLINVLSGNLSHQIEHHFYPDIPANRYAELAVEVREICARYGQHYNTGTLPRQFGQVVWRILRHAFPSRPRKAVPMVQAEAAA